MHIPDGYVSGTINVAAAAVSGGACAVALWRARRTLGERGAPLLGVMAAFLFAAQMLNFPVGAGTSGHLLGAALAAVLVGPWNTVLILTAVLLIQCFLFADGGVTALGTNLLNMGVIGGLGGYGLFWLIRAILPRGRRSFLAAVAGAAWASVVLAAGACAVELAWSGTIPLRVVLPAMLGVHVAIGVGEAVVTAAAVSLVLMHRPDLLAGCPAFARPAGGSAQA